MWKTILIDKSVIEGLNPDEARELADTYFVVLPPILIDEMTSMLAKEKKNRNLEEILKSLARKTINNSLVVPHARLLAKKNLLGKQIPMDGKMPLMGGELIRQRDGEFKWYYDTTKDKKILSDWSKRDFASYRSKARDLRNRQHEFDYNRYHKEHSDIFSRLPKFNTLDEFTKWFEDTHLANISQKQLFNSIVYGLLNDNETARAKENWKNSGKKAS